MGDNSGTGTRMSSLRKSAENTDEYDSSRESEHGERARGTADNAAENEKLYTTRSGDRVEHAATWVTGQHMRHLSPHDDVAVARFMKEEAHPFVSDMSTSHPSLDLPTLLRLDRYMKRRQLLRKHDLVHSPSDKYTVLARLSEGRFGAVYLVRSDRKKQLHALKTEWWREKGNSKIKNELIVLRLMKQFAGKDAHFGSLVDYGRAGDLLFVVSTLFGANLSKCMEDAGGRFQPVTALYIALKTIKCIQDLHVFGLIHRDIKPANFCVGYGSKYRHIYLVDFSMATEIRAPPSDLPPCTLPFRNPDSARYASLDAHKSDFMLPRSDLESWSYMCIDLFDASALPWKSDESPTRISRHKKKFVKYRSSALSSLPSSFLSIFDLIWSLSDAATPDYQQIRNHVKIMLANIGGTTTDYDVEWAPRKPE